MVLAISWHATRGLGFFLPENQLMQQAEDIPVTDKEGNDEI
ncbi:hypothetical protein L580_4179 [Serratia fonticola AU-P3(3)]|nr:hypothetical protein L580_4179 [Serratia fonticola AU-P3(3)]